MKTSTEEMTTRLRSNAEDMAIRTWRQQLDNATRLVEAMTEGSMRMSELQLRAATEANEMVEQARKLLEKAGNPLELWRIQSDWLALSVDRSLSYWNEFRLATAETQSSLSRFWSEPGSTFPTQANMLPEASKTAFVLMDDAYRRWRETTMQLWDMASEAPLQSQRGARQGQGREQAREARENNREAAPAQRPAKQES